MGLSELKDAAAAFNLCSLSVALRNRSRFRSYLSYCLRKRDEEAGLGLPIGNPIRCIVGQGWGQINESDRAEVPTLFAGERSTSPAEALVLAQTTRVLRPKKVFEIGTYQGRTTSLFIVNSPQDSAVFTLDLPEQTGKDWEKFTGYLPADVDTVLERRLGYYLRQLGLAERRTQILCDSMEFDPTPHLGTVELGFIDGSHAYEYVKNDTEKMALMMSDRGVVFWHDYGGKGSCRPLAEYLEGLGRKSPIYRIRDTSLAWSTSASLKDAIGMKRS